MASATLLLCTSKSPNNTPFSSSTKPPLSLPSSTKPSQLFLHGKLNHSFKVSCNVTNGGDNHDLIFEPNSEGKFDRRNVLLGLGGLYGAANLSSQALANPIPPPDLKACGIAHIKEGKDVPYTCCPPMPSDMDSVPYYKFPPMSKLRIRPAAQNVDEEYIAKYQLAMSRMRELDKDPTDPLGFKQQANIHCAYCNGAYKVGGKELQVHFSWLFFPFHRWYLYFYERILGSLIDDPTFGLPYWNWDHPKGMRLPAVFDTEGSSLHDEHRNQSHRKGKIIDLGYFGTPTESNELQTMANNLTLMYRQMITNAPCASQFFGESYTLGSNPKPGMGTIENIPHTPVHIWLGDPRSENGEDMGNFYSAGLDPAFYCHHGNVDRMWSIWKTLGGKRQDITSKEYLDAEFFFYDENRNPFRVKVRDCLNTKKMGYEYQPMPTPWRNFKPLKKSKAKLRPSLAPTKDKVFPIPKLDRAIYFSIQRPASSRTQQEKDDQEEILVFKNVKFDDRKYVRFDVFLNVDKTVNANELDKAEFSGSYTNLPHVHSDPNKEHVTQTNFKLAITELLEDIELEDEDTIVVTVVPKVGGEEVAIEDVEITLVNC